MGRPTTVLIEAGEIVQSLKPERLATLALVEDDSIETQQEIADALGCSPPTVSNHLKSFAKLPLPIVDRDDLVITSNGESVLGRLHDFTRSLGTELGDIDWRNHDDRAEVDRCLTPLHSSRGSLLFLVLVSIGVRNSSSEMIDLLNSPEPIRISSVVADVQERQQERGETVSREQVRWRLTKLEDTGCITLDNKTIEIIKKGEAQARFFEQIMQLVEAESSDNTAIPLRTGTEPSEQPGTLPGGDDAVMVNFEIKSDAKSFVPEYHRGDESVITLHETMTTDEFVELAAQLRQEYDGDETFALNWMLRTQPENERPLSIEPE